MKKFCFLQLCLQFQDFWVLFLPSVDKIGFLFPGLCLCIILKILVSKSVWDRLQLKVLCNDRIKISKSVLVSQIFMVLISTKSI